jgi:hypothetical protein
MFTREIMTDPFLNIFMARGREKEQGKNDKSEVFPRDVWGFPYNHQGNPMIRNVMLILGCYLVFILRKGEWNKLTGYPKDCGKNQLNSMANSLQPRKNDVDRTTYLTFQFFI